MTTKDTDFDRDDESREDDPGFAGGGGVARTAEGDAEETLDEHGDNLAKADEKDA